MKVLIVGGHEYRLGGYPHLVKLADSIGWTRDDLQTIYNKIPGVPPKKRLRNRPTATEAIWKALPEVELKRPPVPDEPVDSLKAGMADAALGKTTVKAVVLEHMTAGGATVESIQALTRWQAHTIRGFISTLRSKGYTITTTKVGRQTEYRLST